MDSVRGGAWGSSLLAALPLESGSQHQQSTSLWVRPSQERGKVAVMPELCCRVSWLVFLGRHHQNPSQLSKVVGLTVAPPPCLTERASQGWTGTFVHTVSTLRKAAELKEKALALQDPQNSGERPTR